ncbi:BlaI/MecI/CopY family transcriptional regulator [Leekyejoonella antrihumi]|uniref:BlaI/MecI/CopY family transcriptional regulator n=1 Tax=Leekyejoonella antrihumi TaxID=1660198 RepID=A0A563DZT4_9MICO|nr:BlaI/MecI/CopY family transcriptional regulator [Leekyejoonella antrihumi]TWP35746.1 BlaI/MecI/CopY family transcriptional regulator [Leekyejoonella antrihumi]
MAGQGKLERAILRALWEHPDGMTARQVADVLPGRDRATTTVLTVLDRLRQKDLATRDELTRPHIYRAAISREDYIAAMMLDALGQTADRDAALTRFLGGVTDTDTAHLRRALRRARPPQ